MQPDYYARLFPVLQITPHTVIKTTRYMDEESSEVNALNVLFANTTIPVPRVRRVFHDEFAHHIAMDKVEGCTLAHVWPHYSLWQKIRVAFTLRRYIRQLRRFCKAPPVLLQDYWPGTSRECPRHAGVILLRYSEPSILYMARSSHTLHSHPLRTNDVNGSSPKMTLEGIKRSMTVSP